MDQGRDGYNKIISLNLDTIPSTIHKMVFAATIDGAASMANLSAAEFCIKANGQTVMSFPFSGSLFSQEKAVMVAEIYLKNVWRVAAVAQGFNGGLAALLTHFGGEVSDVPAPAPVAPTPPPAPKVSLSKITLAKKGDSHKVSLKKTNEEIVINLNWSTNADLDLGCFYEGRFYRPGGAPPKGLIDPVQYSKGRGGPRNRNSNQGCYTGFPWVWSTGDDRTGSVMAGESILLNPKGVKDLKRMTIYAFIFGGAPRWGNTDAVVTVHVPGNPDISVEMGRQNSRKNFCVIAGLEFFGENEVKVTKNVTFHDSHSDADRTYGWGFKYSAGSKD
jgi:tellurite resistance protein TerA